MQAPLFDSMPKHAVGRARAFIAPHASVPTFVIHTFIHSPTSNIIYGTRAYQLQLSETFVGSASLDIILVGVYAHVRPRPLPS